MEFPLAQNSTTPWLHFRLAFGIESSFLKSMALPHKLATLLYCFNEHDDVLLLERTREPNRGLWSPCGGKIHVEEGESPYGGACREALEELGISIRQNDLHLTGIISEQGYGGTAHWLMFLFELRRRLTELPPEHAEGRFGFFSAGHLADLRLPQTDRETIWPLFWKHRGGFFAAHCRCQPMAPIIGRWKNQFSHRTDPGGKRARSTQISLSSAAQRYLTQPVFKLLKKDQGSLARLGRLVTRRGVIDTPVFMPVGTQGSVKALDPRELREMGTQVILGNTYHLYIRPGLEIIQAAGGLHQFINWPGPILTDSGGFQVFSLAKIRKIKTHGVEFRSHLDGSLLFLGPKEAMEIQRVLGSDIAMVFDDCPPHTSTAKEVRAAVDRTIRWAKECREQPRAQGQFVFGIVQGGSHAEIREECAKRSWEWISTATPLGE
jgi:ADP-ribose pyrophosphatase YjhB (NUDIX family)